MDPSFVRSLPEQAAWQAVDSELKSGKNIWRDLIRKFRLLDLPYAAAVLPSLQLLGELEKEAAGSHRQRDQAAHGAVPHQRRTGSPVVL